MAYGLRPATVVRPRASSIEGEGLLKEPSEKAPGSRQMRWGREHFMTLATLVGVCFAVGHDLYYSRLDNEEAGDEGRQQWSIRIGTVLAFLSTSFFAGAVAKAASQWLWLTLSKSFYSIRSIDSAFQLDRDLTSFFNWETVLRFKMVALLAFLAWTIPIVSSITPATLTIALDYIETNSQLNITAPDIVNPLNSSRFSFVEGSSANYLNFNGPTTVMTRIAAATAYQGQILPMGAPAPNVSYAISFAAPSIACNSTNSTVNQLMYNFWNTSMAKGIQPGSDPMDLLMPSLQYFAFSPQASLSSWQVANELPASYGIGSSSDIELGNMSQLVAPSIYTDISDLGLSKEGGGGSNQIWMIFPQPGFYNQSSLYSKIQNATVSQYFNGLICKMYNSSYTTNITFQNGVQSMSVTNLTLQNYVYMPGEVLVHNQNNDPTEGAADAPNLNDYAWFDQSGISYSGYMLAIMNMLRGTLAVTPTDESLGWATPYVTSNIIQTALAGSQDLRGFFELSYFGYDDYPGRLADVGLARNRTLSDLIEELSQNVTMSLMSSEVLSRRIQTTVTSTNPITVYVYSRRNLWIAYGTAVAATLVGIFLGYMAVWTNGVAYTNSFSTIVQATRNPALDSLQRIHPIGIIPLDSEAGRTRLRFGTYEAGRNARRPSTVLQRPGFVVR